MSDFRITSLTTLRPWNSQKNEKKEIDYKGLCHITAMDPEDKILYGGSQAHCLILREYVTHTLLS